MPDGLRLLSSMATKGLLAELAAGQARLEAVGGVDAARRVRAGEVVDVVVLAGGVMAALEAEGHLAPGTCQVVAISSIAAAVRSGAPVPDLADAEAVRRAVTSAGRTGYSTGPSGEHLLRLLDGWRLREALGSRLVQAPPGVPVGRLLAEGAVDLAFQQRSELQDLPGIVIAGMLPAAIAGDTAFTAGVAAVSPWSGAARDLIGYLASPATAECKRKHGMAPPASL